MNGGEQTAWYRRLSLRARMIIVTAAVVSTVLAVGGLLILLAVRTELVDAADEAGQVTAQEIALLANGKGLTRDLPVTDDPEIAVQVVAGGRVVAASRNMSRSTPIDVATQRPGTSTVLQVADLPGGEEGPYRVTARGVETPTGAATIYVAVSIEDLHETMSTATKVLAVGLALLVLVLCGVMWVVIGRTLAPVERIRRQANEISGQHLDRRVAEPVQHDEIGRLARTVNAMLARLEDSAERQQRFVADAAHELRSPVTSLRTQLETAAAAGDGVVQASLPDLSHEVLRMQTLVDRLLLLARADAGDLTRRNVCVDLDDIVDVATSSVLHPQVTVDITDVSPAQVNGDPDLLELVVRNLTENGLRYARSQVCVCLVLMDGQAVLTVDDDGPGIPAERRSEVFRRFTRLDAGRDRDGGGVGLGLAICREIVAAHAGTIEVDRAPIGGARFQVRLAAHGSSP